ncbi:LacI family DNA-binding transcriptional regulator [Alkalihalobacillus hemicellulosilyticus]|uniref:Transcriptional regulator n=1 Tax=Halalkalibacter hemicellulosilyticusJCM 9152 TaxID=1236971 RepID=W4QJI6_9BACI|nr:LacI family DNA-binding transcriptional regulator [Halalkalibacter hemicellulosilyticus]GAE31798.1 transcriptional regulator [Halalkalibacter hemicellulosilyticusJCM 9152]
MATIRQIAEKAGVSSGTVSFILNGKAEKMRISEATQKKVLEIARELGYLPSISARRLRNNDKSKIPVLTILWTLDARASLMSRFLQGIQSKSIYKDGMFELLIQPYENGKLDEVESLRTGTRFNGAIVANASDEDLNFLETNDLKVPVVLYQRYSDKYNTVNVDSFMTGVEVAKYFERKGHERVAIVTPKISSQAVRHRQEGFLDRVEKSNMENLFVLEGNFTEEGGYEVIHKLVSSGKKMPSALFFLSDPMAMGALAACHANGIRVPEDLEIIGHDNDVQTAFTTPPLTTVHLPVEEMASACVNQLLRMMNHQILKPEEIRFKTEIMKRSSC